MIKSITKKYVVESDKVNKTYNILAFADTHFGSFISSELLSNMKSIITSSIDKIDFILISGDIMSARIYLNDKLLDKRKRLLDELSILADAPIFMCLGNHDIGLFNDKDYEKIIKSFESLRNNTNLIPLNNKNESYDGLNISGITLPRETYKSSNMFGKNGEILGTILEDFNNEINPNNFNICLIHDPLSAYHSYLSDKSKTEPYDIIFSGHLHGGYLDYNDLLKQTVEKEGYTEYFKDKQIFTKVPLCGGMYDLKNTKLIVNEGIRRYNGWIPWFIYTTPYYTKIEILPKLIKKQN